MEWLREKLGLESLDAWYAVTHDTYVRNSGSTLLRLFGGSPYKMLKALYPEHSWQPHLFKTSPRSYWETNRPAIENFFNFAAEQCGVTSLDDWYRVSLKQLKRLGGFQMIMRNGGLFTVLSALYPDHKWDASKFSLKGSKKSSQRWLAQIVKKLFPGQGSLLTC